ncbi:MAG: hypothetical protein QW199_00650 [Candidatus Pacearchaeota archaeon]
MKKSSIVLSVELSLIFSVLLFLATFALAQTQLDGFIFKKTPIRAIGIAEFPDIPIEYKLNLKNLQIYSDYYKFFSLLDVFISPIDPVHFDGLEEKELTLKFYLKKPLEPGRYTYTYYIKNSAGAFEDKYTFSIVSAADAFSFTFPTAISNEEEKIKIKVKNNLDASFDGLTLKLESEILKNGMAELQLSLKGYEEKEFEIELNKEKLQKARAGEKLVSCSLRSGKGEYEFEKIILLSEYRNILTESKEKTIFIGKAIEVKKTNAGNSRADVEAEIRLGGFEKAFAKAKPKPSQIKKVAGKYVYVFQSSLEPGESASFKVTINYAWLIIPLIILLIIAIAIYFGKREYVTITKEAKKIKTKAGFGLRVYLTIKNKTTAPLKDVALLDLVPLSMKYHEYGFTLPDKVEQNKLYWRIGELLPGEEKRINYVCLSKLKYEGRLELPAAKLKYIDKKGNKIIKSSNTATLFVEREEEEGESY